MFEETIWIVDEAKLYPHLTKALDEGKATVHDGVAYWAEGSGRTGVIQHLPFKEAPAEAMSHAVGAMQATTVAVAAVSTMVILAALIIQTRYLAGKLEKIQATADEIAKDVHGQNVLFYMDKATEYMGAMESTRTLLQDRSLAMEIGDIAATLIPSMVGRRNQMLSLLRNVLSFSESGDVSHRHFELITNFAISMLEIMPIGIHLEYLLACRVGKLRLGEHLLADGATRYTAERENLRGFMNRVHQKFVLGQLDREGVHALNNVKARVKAMLAANEPSYLLRLQRNKTAPLPHAA